LPRDGILLVRPARKFAVIEKARVSPGSGSFSRCCRLLSRTMRAESKGHCVRYHKKSGGEPFVTAVVPSYHRRGRSRERVGRAQAVFVREHIETAQARRRHRRRAEGLCEA